MAAAHGGPWFTGEKERRRGCLELGVCTVKGKRCKRRLCDLLVMLSRKGEKRR
jgi:hypothetical protein